MSKLVHSEGFGRKVFYETIFVPPPYDYFYSVHYLYVYRILENCKDDDFESYDFYGYYGFRFGLMDCQ